MPKLLHGTAKREPVAHNLAVTEDFVSRLTVLQYDIKAASHYGEIRADLERTGNTIGVNNLYIAGQASSQALTLVTNKMVEFEPVEGLRLVNWVSPSRHFIKMKISDLAGVQVYQYQLKTD